MDTKKILILLALLISEAIIVTGFLLFAVHWESSILVLNILVACFLCALCFSQLLLPWSKLSDSFGQEVGALGLSWFALGLYTIATIGVMYMANLLFFWPFTIQLLIHSGLIALLLLSFVGILSASNKVAEVHAQQTQQHDGLLAMKNITQTLKRTTEISRDLPAPLSKRILLIEENIRFLSPSNTVEAQEKEQLFVRIASELSRALPHYQTDKETVETLLKKLELSFQDRKNLYSN